MHFPLFTMLSALALTAVASPVASPTLIEDVSEAIEERAAATLSNCGADVVFAVRGSDPSQTSPGYNPRYSLLPSGMVNTANAVLKKNGGSGGPGLFPINYTAIAPTDENLKNGNYQASINGGIDSLRNIFAYYTAGCPNSKVFIMGYSQGAQVVSQALAYGHTSTALPNSNRVTAAVLYADPGYVDGLSPIDQGSGANDGKSGTAANSYLQGYLNKQYAGRLQSYCEAGDQFCDSGTGSDAGSIHGMAPEYFQNQATAFLTSF